MADGSAPAGGILDGVRERFEESTDFTVGIEEEYQLLDPATLALTNRYEELMAAADEPLRDRLAGELIASEIEYRTRRHLTFADAARELVEGRLATLALADRLGLSLGISGVHPFSPWTEQRIIDTPHYRRLDEELGYVAWTNNTWSLHLHAGVRGADRAVAVSTAMRSVLPELLALSANSAVFLGRPTRLHSTRVQTFTKSFPRCGVPDAYAGWDDYARFVELLERTNSIVESTQIWWSVRPHHTFGTVEVRICDGQTEMGEALAVAALMLACIAGFAAEADAGRPLPAHARGLIEENIWRAQRARPRGAPHRPRPGRRAAHDGRDRGAARVDGAGARRARPGPFLAGVPRDARATATARCARSARLDELGDVRAMHAEVVERTRRSAEEALEIGGRGGGVSTEGPGPPPELTPEELAAAFAEQLARTPVRDLLLQTMATFTDMAGIRLGLGPGRRERARPGPGAPGHRDPARADRGGRPGARRRPGAPVPGAAGDAPDGVRPRSSRGRPRAAARRPAEAPAAEPPPPPRPTAPADDPASRLWVPPGTRRTGDPRDLTPPFGRAHDGPSRVVEIAAGSASPSGMLRQILHAVRALPIGQSEGSQ